MIILLLVFLILVAVYFGLSTLSAYNKLIDLRYSAEKAYANIDILILKRSELIPQLCILDREEQKRWDELAYKYRELQVSQLNAKIEIYDDMEHLLNKNNNVANESLITLNEGIAHRIAYYNESVELYNSRFTIFPYSYFVKILALSPMKTIRKLM